jgi:flagellar protein FliO/FliZ
MFDLFGAEMPLAVRFFLAFLIVLGLIGVTAWAVRRLGSSGLGSTGVRGRQPRLGVIEHASVDARRRLILVRRDNVEHLLMIGGPSDVIVESNIVRATSAGREAPGARPAAPGEASARAIPLPEIASNGSWPLQPEPSGPSAPPAPPRRLPRGEPIAEDTASSSPQPQGDTPPRSPRESLASLADDLAAHPVPPLAPVASVTQAPPRNRPAPAGRPHPVEGRPDPRSAEAIAAADQTLAEMAQRLEAALRKPKAAEAREGQIPASPAAATPARAPAMPAPEQDEATEDAAASPSAPPPRSVRPVEAKPARPEAKTKEGKALYETLEQEMANLLGRQPNKNG